ncbi:hypothetical protein [Mycobacterium marseillense]|uniref:Uncharacterized protein n=1 Tax=Mycobacterium marseillense TaxID=701042 RepID=A0AAC9VXB3_9MYCO|nr:hypothetical protein [Mycobacterium marseillense]ASW91490.1 hypothetical protein CKJ54_17645 [Mycobacterium marseillense]MCA2264087.1 hypothetical protein [Mycobacterium marseillense]MCV7405963.1 hypothetical protein [Mycobacterium marseillense]MDM3974769.1 hypothetical protein [Mycobacterium marseillense]OBJ74028.1 hypothetical protein A5626_21155 [Mycobacterium marseillense]
MSFDSTGDGLIAAVGKVTEALETIERARGHLYSFHQLTGHADLQLDAAVSRLHELGHSGLAQHISRELIGRNVLPGRWSFQVIEDYDDGYYRCFTEIEQLVRTRLAGGQRHRYEMAMKEDRRTAGHPAHTASPTDESADGEIL